MKKKILSTVALCVAAVILAATAYAGQIPTIYWNDASWYRDAISPLIKENSTYYVPAEMCAMFDGIEVEVVNGDNVLVYDRESGGYVSVLISAGKAAVNGEIVVADAFKSGGACYIDVELLASAIGLEAEYFTYADETEAIRLTDGRQLEVFENVIARNIRADKGAGSVAAGGSPSYQSVKTIYLLCENDAGGVYSICDTLEKYALPFTVFLRGDAADEDVFLAASHGEFGLSPHGESETADKLNERITSLSYRAAKAVIDVDGTGGEDILGGYAVISPDFTVDGGTYAMGALNDVVNHLVYNDSCFVYVKPSWNGCEFLRLVSQIDKYTFRIANIAE